VSRKKVTPSGFIDENIDLASDAPIVIDTMAKIIANTDIAVSFLVNAYFMAFSLSLFHLYEKIYHLCVINIVVLLAIVIKIIATPPQKALY
tara:strand:- start:7462 stop:7734 length:273 start_codon:yes stop_codon:yes gene_type:complete